MTNKRLLNEARVDLMNANTYMEDGALASASRCAIDAGEKLGHLAIVKARAMQDLMDGTRKSTARKRGVSKKPKI